MAKDSDAEKVRRTQLPRPFPLRTRFPQGRIGFPIKDEVPVFPLCPQMSSLSLNYLCIVYRRGTQVYMVQIYFGGYLWIILMFSLAQLLVTLSLIFASSNAASPPLPSVLGRNNLVGGSPAGNLYAAPAVGPVTITVTQTTTFDRSVIITDTAYNSVPVTITDFALWTSTLPTRVVVRTPVDDDVAIQTRQVARPATVTVLDQVSNIRVVTDVSVEHFTITHSYYNIMQSTYTRTTTQAITISSTLVRTNVKTDTRTETDFRTVYNTVYVQGSYQ
ncbi:uncharacterized protein [Penaeus vannamei]|uniref:uncharacterized protein n=1 Tax=Penaeus vannamei TaxID=6689 RepID=UPI00387F7AA7